MFIVIATKPLNDGTKGFRFNFLGTKGIVRKRKNKKRGFAFYQRSSQMTAHHIGRYSLYVERDPQSNRKLFHWAG